jgi:hypothetical protein
MEPTPAVTVPRLKRQQLLFWIMLVGSSVTAAASGATAFERARWSALAAIFAALTAGIAIGTLIWLRAELRRLSR